MKHLGTPLIAALVILGSATPASARWPASGGGTVDDHGVASATAPSGNVYVTGTFRDIATFDDKELSAEGSDDIFVVKYDATGEVVWVAGAGGASLDTAAGIVLDSAENVYVAGTFHETLVLSSGDLIGFGPGPFEAADAYSDAFVAKLDSEGMWQWARRLGGDFVDEVTSIAVHPGNDLAYPPIPGSVFVAGRYTCDFGPYDEDGEITTPVNNTNCSASLQSTDLFVVRFDTEGDWLWTTDLGNGALGWDAIDAIAVADTGDLYVTGSYVDNEFTTTGSGGSSWALVTSSSNSGSSSYFINAPDYVSDQQLTMRQSFNFQGLSGVELEFWHSYEFESGWDGGVLEVSTDGSTWSDVVFLGGVFLANGYDEILDHMGEFGNPLSGRSAWTGSSGGWKKSQVDLDPLIATNPSASWRFRWRRGTDELHGDTGWWVDDLRLSDSSGTLVLYDFEPATLVARLSDTLAAGATPVWSWLDTGSLPDTITFSDIAIDDSDNVVVAGFRTADTELDDNVSVTGAGAVVAKFRPEVDRPDWLHAAVANGGEATGVTIDDADNVYVTGWFDGSTSFGVAAPITLVTAGERDIFAAKLDSGLGWQWVRQAGGTGDDWGQGLSTDGATIDVNGKAEAAALHVTGGFHGEASFGEDTCLAAPEDCVSSEGGSDAFVANVVAQTWTSLEGWIAGDEIEPPTGAYVSALTAVPDFYVDGSPNQGVLNNYVIWRHDAMTLTKGKLYALQPIQELEIRWKVDGNLQNPDRIPQTGRIGWPQVACGPQASAGCFQEHVVGAPVEIEPAAGGYGYMSLVEVAADSSQAEVNDSKVFTANRPGFAVVLYTVDEPPELLGLEVVKSYGYDIAPDFIDGKAWTIGNEIVDADHEEIGRTGYALNDTAFFDPEIYDRNARTGTIIPVNRVSPHRTADDLKHMVIIWYQKNFKGVFWGAKPVRYDCRWPADPEKIVIASELGAEVLGQAPLDPLAHPSMELYVQSDPALPGYNPNDEHAFFAPSNAGSGMAALFALRADFGSRLSGDLAAASDPYTLIKYRDSATLAWRFRLFQVLATGAGYSGFDYTGTAGTPVAPPYPVSLLLPGCAETEIIGDPLFKDYSEQLWAKSAGNGLAEYFYRLQPTFVYDLDNNDGSDAEEGQCVPWLARLPEDEGGSASPDDPVEVIYSINWPADVPLLQVGETLLEPKRGLPDIFNQAAVQIVHDELNEATLAAGVYDPEMRLARLIHPLKSRSLAFDPGDPDPDLTEIERAGICYGLGALPDPLPTDIATSVDIAGQRVIVGSADGTIKLAYVLRSRLRYDPAGNKLSFNGLFDDSQAGEPLLLLNVLTTTERDQLKGISSNADWDTCMDKLYLLSRNPALLDVGSCTTFSMCHKHQNTWICQTTTICMSGDGTPESDLLIGFEGPDANEVPVPIEGLGTGHALTAGFAQDTGYVTLAFNNDASLAPLPVSLSIIKVGCLQAPEPPDPPELLSTYVGEIKIIQSDNVFDEQITLRHSGDFAGQADQVEFDWYLHPDEDGTPPWPLPDPDGGQMHGWLKFQVDNPWGANEITLGGANILALSDNWFVVRYRGLPACGNDAEWSVWAGQPGSTPLEPRAMLAEGWVKRVVRSLNPFESRVRDFHAAPTNTFASMLMQLGERWEGDIALNPDPQNINEIGLIEAYQTVMRRAMTLSVNSTPPVNYGPANAAILNVASRLVGFYALLGNEAWADAQDPTVGIRTDDPVFGLGSLAPTIFNFENQTASLLEEELLLLRGRDDSQGPVAARPVYNRLFWNFTSGNGEIAYALSYNISDINKDGFVDELDAKLQYPQAHGDAWGHYLTAINYYYSLLQHPFFTWEARPEAVVVAGVPIQVDYFDERKFAEVAAAKAKAGAEIVDLTYRSAYVEDPSGQWQGYKDTDEERAWGLAEWGKRAGTGAYLDWVVGNAILPAEDPNPDHVGIQRIDREHNEDLDEIITAAEDIQSRIDGADEGLNPLGLAKGVVPFDIDPAQVDAGLTHFEQIQERAIDALDNVVAVWDFANQLNKMLRFNQDTSEDFRKAVRSTEIGLNKRLIEIFGRPYSEDPLYPSGYSGPDFYHYMVIDVPQLAGTPFDIFDPTNPLVETTVATFDAAPSGIDLWNTVGEDSDCWVAWSSPGCNLGDPKPEKLEVIYYTYESPDTGFSFVAPETWGSRPVAGKIQDAVYDVKKAEIALLKSYRNYNNHILDIRDHIDTMRTTFNIRSNQITIQQINRAEVGALNAATVVFQQVSIIANRVGNLVEEGFKESKECLPKTAIIGVASGGDLTFPLRCALQKSGTLVATPFYLVADASTMATNVLGAVKEDVQMASSINVAVQGYQLEMFNLKGTLDQLFRKEPLIRLAVYERAEAVQAAVRKYERSLVEGNRTLKKLIKGRRKAAAAVQEYRYQDMAFRIFRNDALFKYRSAFDMAARYAFLAATAYDYDTNLLGTDSRAGQKFLTDIVRERSIGQVLNHQPVPGSRGLADPLGRMEQNFSVLKGQMGFNNPQNETNRFSVRRELLRILDEPDSDEAWRAALHRHRVDDLWAVPEFRRFCRPFAPQSAGPQPGLVIPFTSTVTFGLNFFGWPLGPGDSAYDSTHFATRVRGVGTWFGAYADLPLSNTPRAYLIPVGADVLRSPSGNNFETREWTVVDQVLPVPFPIGAADLEDEDWLPLEDMLSGPFGEIRRFSSFRAHHFSEPFDDSQIITDSRLIGRSVWNTRWMLIIPGGTLLYDPSEGLDTFIDGQLIPGGNGERDGLGVDDIKIFFKTYAYSGN
jgi:hypothetical protein